MPELPEVETIARGLREAGLVGQTIRDARVRWPRSVEGLAPRAFAARLRGCTIRSIGRRAKFIVIELDGPNDILVHLRMTGRLDLAAPDAAVGKHQHVILDLSGGRQLRFSDPRKFGRWYVSPRPHARLAGLGPEPLDRRFSSVQMTRRLRGRAAMLKPLLLNQSFLAGLGNIYVDEALWDARLHPRRKANTLSAEEGRRLYRAVRKVLRRGIRGMGTSLGRGSTNFYSVAGRRGRNQEGLKVFRKTGEPCPRCGGPIDRIIVGQRSTHICAACQRERA